MVALSRCLSLAAGAVLADGVRVQRKPASTPEHKFIAGVPVLNYGLAEIGGALVQDAAGGEAEGNWLVSVKPGTTTADIKALCAKGPKGCKMAGNPSEGGVPMLAMKGTESELEEMLKASNGAAQFVEPDLQVKLNPEIENLAPASTSWGLGHVGADSRATTGVGVHVYVLDTGIRSSHVDFGGRSQPALDMSVGEDGVGTECKDLSCALDKQGHGTHCAGTAAGTTYGVAPGANVHAVKVLSDSGSGSWSWSIGALDWLATKGARPSVASMSLGGRGTLAAMKSAMDTAVDAGVTVVVAGGNENDDACGYSPAFIMSAITVGSITSTNTRSSFSNYGSCVQIWAPGSDITSAAHDSDTGSKTFSGTSMACPHVSGGAALILEANPSTSPSNVLGKMLDTAATNFITGLSAADVNKQLYVGAGGPPPSPAPVPPARFDCPTEFSSGPDSYGDCTCKWGTSCYENGASGCTFSSTSYNGATSTRWFLPTCEACECH